MSIILDGTNGIVTPDIDSGVSTLGPLTQALNLGSTGQIVFPATQNASANANTLDDYEEGTWTPVGQGASGSAGAYSQTSFGANYTKIGNLVYVAGAITVNNSGSYSGDFEITGLPFPCSDPGSNAGARGSVRLQSVNYSTGGYATAETTGSGNTFFRFQVTVTNTGNNPLQVSSLTSNSYIAFSLTYYTT